MANTILSIADLTQRVEQSAAIRSLIPETFRLSLWVPVLQSATCNLYLAAFYYETPVALGRPRKIYRPSRQIVVDPQSGRLVGYSDAAYADFAPELTTAETAGDPRPVVGEVGPKDVPARSIEELQALFQKLYSAYDRILSLCFQPNDQLSLPDRADIKEFALLFDRLVEPGLKPFYQSLNPIFFAWLESVVSA